MVPICSWYACVCVNREREVAFLEGDRRGIKVEHFERLMETRDHRDEAWELAREYRDKIREHGLPLLVGVKPVRVFVKRGCAVDVYGVYITSARGAPPRRRTPRQPGART
jgi:hypothetical protein